jgi:hypothetical protein
MPTFDFRIRFALPPDYSIGFKDASVIVFEAPSGETIRLKAGRQDQPIQKHRVAALIGGPYPSADAARGAAEQTKRALTIWAVTSKVGIDFGDGHVRSAITDQGKRICEDSLGRPIRNDIHGIDIYESNPGLLFVSIEAKAHLRKGGEAFLNTFRSALDSTEPIEERLQLAMELYCSSFFDVTPRSRFLTLVTALEALLEKPSRSKLAVQLVEALQAKVAASAISTEEKDSIRGSLERLKNESIGRAGKAMAQALLGKQEYGGVEAPAFFTFCYNLRSQIVHQGRPDDPATDVLSAANTCQQFVRDILMKKAGVSV